MKKKVIIIVSAAILLLALLLAAGWFFFFKGKVQKNPSMDAEFNEENWDDFSNVGTSLVFSGVVEPEKTLEVKKEGDKTIGEIYVEAGQKVSKGDPLFTYDVEQLSLNLEQAKLELEGLKNQIEQLKKQVEDLKKEKEKAKAENQLSYTLEINGIELDIRTQEYNVTVKERSISDLQKDIENAVVTSEMDGVIKSINENSTSDTAFITILAEGDYKVKGTANEMQVGAIYEGMMVTVRSRINQNVTFSGTITSIDREAVSDNNDRIIYDGGASSERASKYYFYVELDAPGDLMLGQHVYIEAASDFIDTGIYTDDMFYGEEIMDDGMMIDDDMIIEDVSMEEEMFIEETEEGN